MVYKEMHDWDWHSFNMNSIVSLLVLGLAFGLGVILIETTSSFPVPSRRISAPTTPSSSAFNSSFTTPKSGLHRAAPSRKRRLHRVKKWFYHHIMPLSTNLSQKERLDYFEKCVSEGQPCSAAEHCCNKKCMTGTNLCTSFIMTPGYLMGLI